MDGYGDAAVYRRKNAYGQQPVFAADCRHFAVDFLLQFFCVCGTIKTIRKHIMHSSRNDLAGLSLERAYRVTMYQCSGNI